MLKDFRISSLINGINESLKERKLNTFCTLKVDDSHTRTNIAFEYREICNFREINSQSILFLLMGIFVYTPSDTEKSIAGNDIYTINSYLSRGATRSNLKKGLADIKPYVIDCLSKYTSNLTGNIFTIIKRYIYHNTFNAVEYKRRISCLIDWCLTISDIGKQDNTFGKLFSDFKLKYVSDEFNFEFDPLNDDRLKDIAEIFSACLQLSLEYSNINDERRTIIKAVDHLDSKPTFKFDPYTVDMSYQEYFSNLTCSTALKYRLISEEDADDPNIKECFSLAYILNFIQKNACLIRDLQPNINEKSLDIYVNQFQPSTEFTMRFCDTDEDIDKCIQLVYNHQNEFLPKVTWKNNNYSIYQMSIKGLKTEKKWRALAYFKKYNGQENILSYVDCKQRIDGNIELGVALSSDKYRRSGLVTSLIYYHILNNFFATIFTGTYDTNKPMKNVLKNCGFSDHYIIDQEKKQKSNVIRERFEVIPEPGQEPQNVNRDSYYYMRLPEQLKLYEALSKK